MADHTNEVVCQGLDPVLALFSFPIYLKNEQLIFSFIVVLLDYYWSKQDLKSITYIILLAILFYLFVQGIRLRRMVRRERAVLEQYRRERHAVIMYLNNMAKPAREMKIDTNLDEIVRFVMELTGAAAGACYLVSPDDNCLYARSVIGMFPPLKGSTTYVLTKQKHLFEKIKREKIEIGSGLIGDVAIKKTAFLVSDPASDPRIPRASLDMVPFSSIMAAPMVFDNHIIGVLAVVKGTTVLDATTEELAVAKESPPEFTEDDLGLLTALAEPASSSIEMFRLFHDLATEEAKRQTIENELGMAHEFQQMLLPTECPEVSGYDVAAFSRAAREVGGDYYDMFWVDDDKRYLGLVIADVSGKGVPGAFVMAMTRSAIRVLSRNRLNPIDVILRCNDRLYEDIKENVFVTISYGILDISTGLFRYVRAGHEPLLKYDPNETQIIKEEPSGVALGMVPTDDLQLILEEKTTMLLSGMSMILYTDGVVEAENRAGQEMGRDVFYDYVMKNKEMSADQLIKSIMDEIDKFADGTAQHDDITLMVIKSHNNQEQAENTAASYAPV